MKHLYEQVLPLREASRFMVRELGFLQTHFVAANISHSHCHTLMEIERRGRCSQNELSEALHLDKSTTSRNLAQLLKQGYVQCKQDSSDKRANQVMLTSKGKEKLREIHAKSNERVQNALDTMSDEERTATLRGLALYAQALARSRHEAEFSLRPISKDDNAAVASVIRTVMPEFGCDSPGHSLHDPEVNDMFSAYNTKGSAFFVVTLKGRIVGCAGIAPLKGDEGRTCELRKMYFLAEARGRGWGQKMMDACLTKARELRYQRCYLETMTSMHQAGALYKKNGFRELRRPLGNTGHFACDAWYVKTLGRGPRRAAIGLPIAPRMDHRSDRG